MEIRKKGIGNMKLRKLIIFFLAALMAVTFIGCGEKEPEPETTEAILQLLKDIKPAELKQYYIKADSEKTIEELSSANYIVSKDYDYENVNQAIDIIKKLINSNIRSNNKKYVLGRSNRKGLEKTKSMATRMEIYN